MSRFLTKVVDKYGERYIEEIESMEVCKWRINDVCCNENSIRCGECIGMRCNNIKDYYCFEKEDGIIKEE